MGIGSNKEGFSVFGVLNKCVTSMGRRLLRLWFTRPIIDLHALNDRQDAIQARHSCLPASSRVFPFQQCAVRCNATVPAFHMLDCVLSCIRLQHMLTCMLAPLHADPHAAFFMVMSQHCTTLILRQVLAGVPDTCKVLRNILRHIKDVPQQLQRLQAQSARDAKDFSALTDSLANLLLLRSAVASAGLEAPRRPGT